MSRLITFDNYHLLLKQAAKATGTKQIKKKHK